MKEIINNPHPRKMIKDDLKQAVKLHRECIPDHFSTGMGMQVLRFLYAQAVDDPKSIAAVLEMPGARNVIGIAVGTIDSNFEIKLMCRHPFSFLWGVLRGLFISPAIRQGIRRRLAIFNKAFLKKIDDETNKPDAFRSNVLEARFLYVAVYQDYRGGRNAERLVQYFTQCIFQIGATRLRGVVYPENLASLILYKRLGWNVKKTIPSRVDVWIDDKEISC